MNEVFFILQILFIGAAVLVAFRFGKEALIAIFCLQAIVANVFILKQMRCFGLIVSCTDSYIIGCDFSLGLLQKHFGEKAAKRATIVCLSLMLFFLAASWFQLAYTPSIYDKGHAIYSDLFAVTPRVLLASLFTSFTAQKINIYLQKTLESSFPKAPLPILLFTPIIISQGYDTVVFSFLGLYGTLYSIKDIMIMSFLIKCLSILGMTLFAKLSKKISPATP